MKCATCKKTIQADAEFITNPDGSTYHDTACYSEPEEG